MEDTSQEQIISFVLTLINKYKITLPVPHSILDIGACDSEYYSNSFLPISMGFVAWLIEPVPENFARLESYYKGSGNVHLINAAVDEHDGESILYRHLDSGHHNVHYHVLASLRNSGGASKAAWQCKTISPATLCSIVPMHQIGILSLDTEQWDEKILSGLFEVTRARPPIIIIEEVGDFHQKLLEEGYTPINKLGAFLHERIGDNFLYIKLGQTNGN